MRTDDKSPTSIRCRKLSLALTWAQPALALVLARITFHEDSSIPTACVGLSGKVRFNGPFAASLSDRQLVFVIAHECMHLVLRFFDRRGARDLKTWNKASDRALNQILREGNIGEAPSFALFPPAGMLTATSEELYEVEEEDDKEDDKGKSKAGAGCGVEDDSGEAGAGDGEDDGTSAGDGSSAGKTANDVREQLDRQWREVAVQTAAVARGTSAGKAFSRLFVRSVPRAPWDSIVRSALSSVKAGAGADDFSFDERDRRTLDPRVILPGTIATKATAAIVIDSSGSMNDEMLAAAVKHAVDASKSFGVRVYLVVHDAVVQHEGWINGVTVSKVAAAAGKGRGGTNAAPAYAAIEKLGCRFSKLLHLTDGELGVWPKLPANVHSGIAALVKPRYQSTSKLPGRFSEVLVKVGS